MTKQELASYLASLISIVDSMDDAGAQLRPAWLVEEYDRTWKEFKQEIKDEARKSKQQRGREPEEGTPLESGESGRSGPVGSGDGNTEIGNDVVRRSGL